MPFLVSAWEILVVLVVTALPTVPFGIFVWWVMRRRGVRHPVGTPRDASTEATPFSVLTAVGLLITAVVVGILVMIVVVTRVI